jgi:NAD(P)-dependent dehydrogenase (short-subunit alcohol dehydrogenase family)
MAVNARPAALSWSGLQLLIVGAATGAAATAGHALLLYTGAGFLRTAGFLVALTLLSLAGGLWAGHSLGGRTSLRARRSWTLAAFAIAGVFAAVWSVNGPLRDSAIGGALAVLVVLAEPAYTSGALFAVLAPRAGTHTALAFAGTALGVVLAAAWLIPRFDASAIFLGSATAMFLATLAPPGPRESSGGLVMKDRVVIVTGVGARGQLGYTLAERFLEAGARVIVTGRNAEVEALAGELRTTGEVVGVVADLMVDTDVARLIDTARTRFGRLDAVVNTAGGLSVIKPLAETSPDEWRREIERNAETVLRVSTAALPLLRESKGALVNFASPAGLRAVKRLGAYSAAKAAVVALTRAMALEERANGVRVNAIAPGMIDTDQNRTAEGAREDARYVTRDEVAAVTLFLASPSSSGISGETIHVLGETLR